MLKYTTTLLAALLLPAFLLSLNAQTWYRDSTFGMQGIAWIDADGSDDYLLASGILPDGQMLTLFRTDGVSETTLAMLTPEGQPVLSFGDNGRLVRPETSFYTITPQADGRFLAAGVVQDWTTNNSSLWRYLPDGTPDSSFGGDGQVDSLFGNFYFQRIENILELPGGKILVAGIAQDNGSVQHVQLVRLNADGSTDLSFGANGVTGFSFPFEEYRFNLLSIQPDGKILLGGNVQSTGHRNLLILRFLPDGATDMDFGTAGKVNTDFNFGDDFINQLLLYPDGKILAIGGYQNKSTGKFVPAMARYLPNGKSDPGFGQAGELSLSSFVPSGTFGDVQLLPDGYLLAVLPKSAAGNTYKAFLVKRFKPDGLADDSPNSETVLDDDWGIPVNPFGLFRWASDNTLIHFSGRLNTAPLDRQLAVARYAFDGFLTGLPIRTQTPRPEIRLSPNPTQGAATLTVKAGYSGRGALTIVSASGTALLLKNIDNDPANPELSIPLPETASWPAGNYLWLFTPERGIPVGGCWIKLPGNP